MTHAKNVKFINPPNRLKMKVGGGGIPEDRIKQAQSVMDNFIADFAPVAQDLLKDLETATGHALKNLQKKQKLNTDEMVFPIMQLKANGAMLKYQLLTDVADICLQFMETVDEYNNEAISIIQAHENAINLIIANDLQGDGGQEGYALVQELHKACKRYFKKYSD